LTKNLISLAGINTIEYDLLMILQWLAFLDDPIDNPR